MLPLNTRSVNRLRQHVRTHYLNSAGSRNTRNVRERDDAPRVLHSEISQQSRSPSLDPRDPAERSSDSIIRPTSPSPLLAKHCYTICYYHRIITLARGIENSTRMPQGGLSSAHRVTHSVCTYASLCRTAPHVRNTHDEQTRQKTVSENGPGEVGGCSAGTNDVRQLRGVARGRRSCRGCGTMSSRFHAIPRSSRVAEKGPCGERTSGERAAGPSRAIFAP